VQELNNSAADCAQKLLGWYLIRDVNGQKLIGKVVETEAYDQKDAASHSYKGKTPRTEVMFGPPGRAYVYFTYGMHYCFNVVVGPEHYGSAVLIRALEPIKGIDLMRENRKTADDYNLTSGPAKLCQAFAIDKNLNGHDLSKAPLILEPKKNLHKKEIIKSTRIGISKDTDRLWRFYIKGNSFISKR
jgi:DNA-3-methyladenine glycosylase